MSELDTSTEAVETLADAILGLPCLNPGKTETCPDCDLVNQASRMLEALAAERAHRESIFEATVSAMNGEPVSDFMASFPTVRQALDLLAERDELLRGRDAYTRQMIAQMDTLRAERDALSVKLLVTEQARTLSLLGRSSEQELREDNLRIALAEVEVERDALKAECEQLHEQINGAPVKRARKNATVQKL